MFRDRYYQFSPKELSGELNNNFIKTCGLNLEKDSHKRLLKQGLSIRKNVADQIRIEGIISSFEGDVYQNKRLVIGDIIIECPAFQQIPDSVVNKVYFYIVSSDIIGLNNSEDMLQELLRDTWGTLYVDAARGQIKQIIDNEVVESRDGRLEPLFLSDSFGPGFYGMPIESTKLIFSIFDLQKMHVAVLDSGIMTPIKTCAGIYLAVSDASYLPRLDCKGCLGSYSSCCYCSLNRINCD